MNRRQLLALAGVGVSTVLAGCGSSSDGDDSGEEGADDEPDSTADDTETDGADDSETGTPADSEMDPPDGTDPGTRDESTEVPAQLMSPIRDLWTAYNNENADGVRSEFHPESRHAFSRGEVSFTGRVEIRDASVLSREDDRAIIQVDASVTGELDASEMEVYELRRHQGEWKIWAFGSLERGTPESDTAG